MLINTSICDTGIDSIEGSGKPPADIYVKMTVNNTEVYRGDDIEFKYEIWAIGSYAENIKWTIKVPENFSFLSSNSRFLKIKSDSMSELLFDYKNMLKIDDPLIISYSARTKLNSSIGYTTIDDLTIYDWDWEGPTSRGRLFPSEENPTIYIKNRKPGFLSARITVLSTPPTPLHNRTLLFKFREEYEPIQVKMDVDARDIDDEYLTYTLIAEPLNRQILVTNKTSKIFNLEGLNPGNYWFKVRVNDTFDENVINAVIYYDNVIYDKLIINTIRFSDTLRDILILSTFLILFFLGVFKTSLRDFGSIIYIRIYNILPAIRLVARFFGPIQILVLIWIIYIFVLSVYLKDIFYRSTWPVYFTSFEFFMLVIYFSVFIIIAYFAEICFSEYDHASRTHEHIGECNHVNRTHWHACVLHKHIKHFKQITSILWLINVISMTVLLVALAFIVPSFDFNTSTWEQYFQWYYSTMAQVFASILAIVVVFYTALPNKNITVINVGRPANELGFEVEYKHPEILRLFVIIYGIILSLSFVGLSSGVYVDFSRLKPFIDLSRDNLPNLISIANFEITLLLIPPAISCLYALMRITAFTGTIELNSYPSSAKIYLINMIDEEKVFDTKLVTPCTLMLPEGKYLIILEKDGYHKYQTEKEKPVSVLAGTEQKYKYMLKKT